MIYKTTDVREHNEEVREFINKKDSEIKNYQEEIVNLRKCIADIERMNKIIKGRRPEIYYSKEYRDAYYNAINTREKYILHYYTLIESTNDLANWMSFLIYDEADECTDEYIEVTPIINKDEVYSIIKECNDEIDKEINEMKQFI